MLFLLSFFHCCSSWKLDAHVYFLDILNILHVSKVNNNIYQRIPFFQLKKNSHETLLVPVLQFVHHSPASLFKLLKLGISSNYSIAHLAPYLLLIFVCFLLPPMSPLPAASLKSSFTPHIISLLCSFSQGSCKQALVASTPPNKFSDLSSTTVE